MKKPNTREYLSPGGIYHVYARGNNKENLFKAPENYPYFLSLWKKYTLACADTFAYCLLPNHFHFCLRIKTEQQLPGEFLSGEKGLHQPFGNCFNAYTKYINIKHGRRGSLFEENYRRKKVSNDAYLQQLIAYIHANPRHHSFRKDFTRYPHSSYQSLLSGQPTLLMREEVLTFYGGREGFLAFHQDYKNWKPITVNQKELEE